MSGVTYDAVGTAATQGFDNRNAGTGKNLTASGLVMADGNGGANYAISYVDNVAGVITPAALSIVADVSDWDKCQIIIPGGQSGHVASPHYADLIPLWRDGVMLSMPFTRAAVDRNAKERLVLMGKEGNK